jgi:hypothetical protein
VGAVVTRLFDPARGVEVELGAEGAPSRVDGVLAKPAGRWIVEVDWWRRAVAREYWKLVVGDRVLCEVYHDLEQDAWFLERVYD